MTKIEIMKKIMKDVGVIDNECTIKVYFDACFIKNENYGVVEIAIDVEKQGKTYYMSGEMLLVESKKEIAMYTDIKKMDSKYIEEIKDWANWLKETYSANVELNLENVVYQ